MTDRAPLPGPEPDWNSADSVAQALRKLESADDEASALEAYDQFLWAVGDNHAGSFYPVVLSTLAELARLLADGGFWTQRAVMEALIDLSGSFVPQPGHEWQDGVPVQPTLQAAVQALRPQVLRLCAGNDARSQSAQELLELIDDQAPPHTG